ncbi:saccharopine dehydrogenase NADP-binding domain-containing protein, partial [Lutimonas sp.]|uniref:saccharopine dehydrogenase NADP-binding domain-containing protein n=1 Tax=Lutimonas sp. TaxID=1872403 RepID=UPI003C70FA19
MRRILIVGAGRSSSALVRYLLEKSFKEKLKIVIADISIENAKKLVDNHENSEVIELDIFDSVKRQAIVKNAAIVISM